MKAKVNIRRIEYKSAGYEAAKVMREELLRRPLGLALTDEDTKDDKDAVHILAEHEGRTAGTLTLIKLDDSTFKMRQVAVDERLRGLGIGARMVCYAEGYAVGAGFDKIVLNARKTAEGFYIKMGYKAVGEEFEEVGITHIRMEKELARDNTGKPE